MSGNWTEEFINALHRLEEEEETEPLVEQFAPEARLWTVIKPEPVQGAEAIQAFWQQYRAQFQHVHSTFERIIEAGDEAALEWRAEGTLSQGGSKVRYRGVTLLQRGPQGITGFSSYYDIRPFLDSLGFSAPPMVRSGTSG